MKYQNTLTITMYAETAVAVRINADTVVINNTVEYQVVSEPNIDYTVTIEHADCVDNFFYIKRVKFGLLDITDLLHHNGICSVNSKETGDKIANFVEDVGSPDRVVIQINQDFYKQIFTYSEIIKV